MAETATPVAETASAMNATSTSTLPAVSDKPAADAAASSNKVQVSSNKKHVLQEHDEVHLSALGQAISTMVTLVEILKKDGLVTEKRLSTSLETMTDEGRQRTSQKSKMEVVLAKTPDFERLMAEQKDAPVVPSVEADS